MMRRSGRCAVVGVILLSLALFNIYSMMTMFNQHTCSVQGEKTASLQFAKGENNKISRETYGDGSQFGKPDRLEQTQQNRQHVVSNMQNDVQKHRMANRWLHRGWDTDDQMAGLVGPPEPTMGAAQPGIEGVHHHRQHPDHAEVHRLVSNFTLISELNETIHEWPWPTSVVTHQKCEQKKWGPVETMPDVSVIITFHETESISHLLRTVHSIVQRTPRALLNQIILVADNTHKDDLGEVLEVYISAVFGANLVRLLRSSITLGLIKARLMGVSQAQGSVLVFMDSHMEVQHHWLEPLLYEIMQDGGTLASSFLDWFERSDNGKWKYRHGDSSWVTYFDWAFTFGFQDLGSALDKRTDATEAVRSPVTVGGMFAIEKKFFLEIGSYDDQMTRWGGENVDLGFRVWLCGGRVVNVPCSHAAHYESPTSRSYRDSWTADIHHNYQRVAEVWLGPYKKYFYDNFPHLKDKDPGDLTRRLSIMNQCKRSFHWLLQNVIPQLGLPDVDSIAYGGVECLGVHGHCLDSRDLRHPGLVSCSKAGIQSQNFYWNLKGNLRMPIHMVNIYKPGIPSEETIILEENTRLYNSSLGTVWFHSPDGFIIDSTSGRCLQGELSRDLSLQPCDSENKRQRWRFRTYNDVYFKVVASEPVSSIDISVLDKFSQYIQLAQKKRVKYKNSYRLSDAHGRTKETDEKRLSWD